MGPATALAKGDSIDVQLFAPSSVPAPLIAAAAGEGIEIRTISITGLERLDEGMVIAGLTIKAGDILVGNATAKLNDAADALYNTGWFRRKPELTLDSYEGGAILKAAVVENPPYKSARITGNTLISTERLLEEIEGRIDAEGRRTGGRLVPGEVINLKKLVAALDGMLTAYQQSGFIAANVADYSYLVEGPDKGVVEIKLTEGIVEEVIITGLADTRESVVRSQITHVRPGRVLTRSDLERDLNQVYNTGLFEAVTPDLQPSLKEGHAKVVFAITEAPTGQAGLGLGYSTVNGLQGTVSYNERNMFGSGKELGAMVVFSTNKPGFELNFADPYFTDNSFWNVGIFSLHDRQQRYPGLPYESELAIDTKGAHVGYGQHLSDYDSWMASFGVADYEYTIRKGDPFRGYSPEHRARLSARGQTRKLGLTYSHDTRDNKFSTTQGYLGKVTGEMAGFGGDFDFDKWTFESREFFRLGPGSLGFRHKLGMANGDVPIYEEYRLGGVNSIRGTAEDLVTGTHSFLNNVEYRLPINDTFGVVGFWDAGWAGESYSEMNNAMGAGLGVRIRVPALGIGAVRLDYGWEMAGEVGSNKRFHFFFGEMF